MATSKAAHYAQALKAHSADVDGGKSFADRLVAFLVAKKQSKLLASVLATYQRLHTANAVGAKIIVGHATASTQHAKEIEADCAILGAEQAQTVVDESLVGGYIVRTPSMQIDKSYRSALLHLYQRIIS